MPAAMKTRNLLTERHRVFVWLMTCAIVMTIAVALNADETTNPAQESPAQNASTKVSDPANSDPANGDPYGINKKPEASEGIGVDDHVGQFVSGEQKFDNHDNNHVAIGHFFDGEQPVMLSFNYSNCPKLCSVQLQNMTSCLREVDFEVGKDFQLVSVSIDPNEQTSRARDTREKFMGQYNRPESESGWHFLTGDRDQIAWLANECGFRYKYVREQKLFSHPPVFILLSPKGKIVRYIHGLNYDPVTIRRALIEAAEGKIGSPINQLAYGLGCFVFDESTGKYTMQAMAIMRIGGLVTAGLLLVCLTPYWFFSSRNKARVESGDSPAEPSAVPQQL
jgi:protein SCO1/2